ncbi:MAG: ATP-binding protein [Candidatus Kerfeldbacteria bacterium]|nr:ATP-binding protein [Candidatus Kerfeldbacteria bacterium]
MRSRDTHKHSLWYIFGLLLTAAASLGLLATVQIFQFTTAGKLLFVLYGLDIGFSLCIGGFALLQYFSKKSLYMRFVAWAFFSATILRTIAFIGMRPWVVNLDPAVIESWLRWAWFSSANAFAFLLLLSWVVPYITQRFKLSSFFGLVVLSTSVYLSILIPTASVALFDLHFPHSVWLGFTNLWEFIPGVVLLITAVSFMRKDHEWRDEPFFFWITVSVVLLAFSHIFFMSRSVALSDNSYTIALLVKEVANIVGMLGVVVSMWQILKNTERNQDALVSKNATLSAIEAELNEALEKTKSQKREIQQQLNEIAKAHAQDEAMLNSIGDGVVVTDDRGRVIFANPALYSLLRLTPQQMLGKAIVKIMPMLDAHGHLVPERRRPFTRALESGKQIHSLTGYSYQRTDGTLFPASITTTPIHMQDRVIGAIGIIRDITHEKAIDEEKSSFVSVASHQLRTPLTSINWYLEMLLSGETGTLKHQQKEYIEEVHRSSRRLVGLVDDLLNVSRIESGKLSIRPEKIHPVQIITDAIKEVQPLLNTSQAHITFSNTSRSIPQMFLDPNLFHELIHNLLTNAIRYSPHDTASIITVNARVIDVTKKQRHEHLKKSGKYVVFSIEDQGIGIPEEARPQLFQKLFRADNAMHAVAEGTGLGLYLVKMIVDQSGGTIWYTTEEKKGTTFFVAFPEKGMTMKKGEKGLAQYE